jgi:hypothetical protein
MKNGHGMPLHRHTMTKMSLERIRFCNPFQSPNPWLIVVSEIEEFRPKNFPEFC